MIDCNNRTFICSVVYYDIVDYSTKSVAEQIRLKDLLNRLTTEAIQNVAPNDRILLDTCDGTVICFLGDPEDALFVAMSLRDAVQRTSDQFPDNPVLVRFGINLGAVKLVNDINNRKNIIGDGINVGQRIMSFAEPGQILVSRSYFEVVSCLTQEYARLFHYMGMRADKHIRKHEIYSIIKTPDHPNAVCPVEPKKPDDAHIPDREALVAEGTRFSPRDSAPASEQKADHLSGISSPVTPERLSRLRSKVYTCGFIAVAVVIVAALYLLTHRDFGNRETRPGKLSLLPEAHLNSPDKPLLEISPPAETIRSGQPEQATPTPPVTAIIVQQESPGGPPPENTQPAESVAPEQPPRPPPAPSVPDATIQFAVTPWGEVFLDGKRQGASPPLTSLSIVPGKHVIEIFNTAFPPFSQTFEIDSSEKLKFSHKFK